MFVRYDVPNEHGETRRQRYERFNQSDKVPSLNVPESGLYLWQWFFELKRCGDINASNIIDWQKLSRNVITPYEFDILIAMSISFDNEICRMQQEALERQKNVN